MKVTIELIDELRSRVNVSYEEARRVLEKNDGDLIKSIIELEGCNHKESRKPKSEQKEEVKRIANRILQYRFSINSKNNQTLVDLPFIILVVCAIFAFWLTLALFALAIFTSCHINVYKNQNAEYKEQKWSEKTYDNKKSNEFDDRKTTDANTDISNYNKDRTITQDIISRAEKRREHSRNRHNGDNDDGDNEVIIE